MNARLNAPTLARPAAPAAAVVAPRRISWARRLSPLLETHISLPPFALLLMVALWVAAFHFIDAGQTEAEHAARTATHELLDTYEAQIVRSLGGIDQTLKLLKYTAERDGPEKAMETLRRNALLPPLMLFRPSLTDRNGVIVAGSQSAVGSSVSGEAYFLVLRTNDANVPYVSQTLGDEFESDPHLHFSRRLNDANGNFAGVATIAVDPAYFTSAYERSREGERGLLGLVGDDNVVRTLRVGDTTAWGQELMIGAMAQGQVSLRPTIPDGVTRYVSVRRLNGFGLTAIVGLDAREQKAAFERQRRAWLAAAGIGSVVLALVVALLSAWSWQAARARRRARHAQATYAAASEASTDAFFVMRTVWAADGTVADFEILATNTRAEEMTGLSKEALRGMLLCETLVPYFRHNGIFDSIARVAREGGVDEGEWQPQTEAMRGRWLHRQVVPVEGGVVGILRDITERKLAESRIMHMAHHDELTDLPNRTLLRLRLTEAIARAAHQDQQLALAFVDLDGFKLINDGLGHNAGDELLKAIAKRMRNCLRRSDTLARFGGDEFVVLLPAGGDPQLLSPVLEKLRQAVNTPVQVAGQTVQVSCSMGVVMYPRDGMDATTLLMNADAAMYRAKDGGRNNWKFYAREMNATGEEDLVLLDGLRQSLEATLAGAPGAAGFSLVYQPKVDLRNGRVFGVEALLRWSHPDHGAVPPLRFIALAEESGLIVPIGEWALRTACRQNQAWRAAGLPPITVSVNVSPRQFEEVRLVERVAGALAESGLPADGLELEVTESLIMRDLARSVDKMQELEKMGVSLSIDDFGTGYSSLSALKSFPISRLKIDKSFVSELAGNPDDQAIAAAVISLGHKLNLRVIAEGVETEAQSAFLRENDCDEMQGYLFSPPVPAERITAMLATRERCACCPVVQEE